MFFHVLLTTKCNLQCRYCFGKSCEDIGTDFGDFEIDYSLPSRISYSIDLLRDFCEKDPECVLTFYGGEPMLCIEEIKRIMDNVKVKHFMTQTNGLFLRQLEPEYVNRFHTILVSIDGDQELTDYYRGQGVYRKVINNLKLIKRNGFDGELIARMTVMEETDIFKQVLWLLNNQDYSFSSVHWQIDAGFWKNDFKKRQFRKWANESYNPGIRRLIKFWVDFMEKYGKILKLYPLLGVMQSLLLNEKSLLRCGSGWVNYSILTDGTITPCPIMGGMKDFYVGHIKTANPLSLEKVFVTEPCTECKIFPECGGRCLYANITKQWSKEAYSLVCDTVKNLIDSLKQELPKVRQLIAKQKIELSDFDYMKYNGCEIIP